MSPKQNSLLAIARTFAPAAPEQDLAAVVDHALHSKGLKKAAPETAIWLSLVAYIRHNYTDYDDLLDDGYDHDSARYFCREQIAEVLATWGCHRPLADEDSGEEPLRPDDACR